MAAQCRKKRAPGKDLLISSRDAPSSQICRPESLTARGRLCQRTPIVIPRWILRRSIMDRPRGSCRTRFFFCSRWASSVWRLTLPLRIPLLLPARSKPKRRQAAPGEPSAAVHPRLFRLTVRMWCFRITAASGGWHWPAARCGGWRPAPALPSSPAGRPTASGSPTCKAEPGAAGPSN